MREINNNEQSIDNSPFTNDVKSSKEEMNDAFDALQRNPELDEQNNGGFTGEEANKKAINNNKELKYEDLSFDDAQNMATENPEKYNELKRDAQDRDMAERYGISVDDYKAYIDTISHNESKNEGKTIEERFNDIQDRVKDFNDDYNKELYNRDKDGHSKNKEETIRELGKGVSLNKDIDDLKQYIDAKKDDCYKTIEIYNKYENSPITKEEYDKSVENYKKYESMSNSLSSMDSKIDGHCYALSEKCENVPYIQMTEHYGKDNDQKLNDIDKYMNGDGERVGVSQKLDDGKTTFTDKFIYESYDDKISKDLSYIKKYGTDEQKEKAEKLEKQFNSIGEQFKDLHKESSYKDDGTFNEKYENSKHGITIKNKENIHLESADNKHSNLYDTAKFTEKSELSIGNLTEKGSKEYYLYTGEETGKKDKSVHVDVVGRKSEKSVDGYNKDGERVYNKDTKREESLLNANFYSSQDGKTKASYKSDISLVHAKVETSTELNGIKNTNSVETNVGHASAKLEYDLKNASASVKGEASATDVGAKHKHQENGHNYELEANAKFGNVGASAGIKNGLPKAEVHKKDADFGVNGSIDGVNVFSLGNSVGKESKSFSATDSFIDSMRKDDRPLKDASDEDVKSLKDSVNKEVKTINSTKDFVDSTFNKEIEYSNSRRFEERKLTPEEAQLSALDDLERLNLQKKNAASEYLKYIDENPNTDPYDEKHISLREKAQQANKKYMDAYDEAVKNGYVVHDIFEVNDKISKAWNDNDNEKAKEIQTKFLPDFGFEAHQMAYDVAEGEKYVQKDSNGNFERTQEGGLKIGFPANEGLKNAASIDRNSFSGEQILVRYSTAGDTGRNYTTLKNDGSFYSNYELSLPYTEDRYKRKIEIMDWNKYFDTIDIIANKNYKDFNLLHPNLSEEEFSKIKEEYYSLQEKFESVTDDFGECVKNPKYGVMGNVKEIKDSPYVGGAPQFNPSLKNDSLFKLGILKVPDGERQPITPQQKGFVKDYWSLSQEDFIKKYYSKRSNYE